VSGYVAQAAKRALTSRAPPDAYLATDLYQILITPRSGESYQPETPWPVMCSKRQTLDHLMDQVFADYSARRDFPSHPRQARGRIGRFREALWARNV
jgi:hypothetical protein